ncbi:hypothetical protein Tco_1073628 [Tanacetum coccineum]
MLPGNKIDRKLRMGHKLTQCKIKSSKYGIVAPGLTVNADKYDSLIDEKMIKLLHELVTIGIAQTEVGKAGEVCY